MKPRTAILIDAENVMANQLMYGVRLERLVADLREHFKPTDQLVLVVSPWRKPWVSRVVDLADRLMAKAVVISGAAEFLVEGSLLISQSDHLVLVTCDPDLLAILHEAHERGKATTLIAPVRDTSVAMALAATNRLDPSQLTPSVVGFVGPGHGSDMANAIVRRFQQAKQRIVVVDPYVSVETIRMMAFGGKNVELLLVFSKRLTSETQEEAATAVAAGSKLRLYRSQEVHDRLFAVDDAWFQSGGSLKDLGRRWTRLSAIEDPTDRVDTEFILRRLATRANRITLGT